MSISGKAREEEKKKTHRFLRLKESILKIKETDGTEKVGIKKETVGEIYTVLSADIYQT